MAKRLGGVPSYFDTATPTQARQFVRHFAPNVEPIKVYDGIPRDAYFALADEARRLGLDVVGHRPRAVNAFEAAANQKSIHARFLLHESYPGSADLRSPRAQICIASSSSSQPPASRRPKYCALPQPLQSSTSVSKRTTAAWKWAGLQAFCFSPRTRLKNVSNTQRIEAVIFNGNFYDRAALDRITHHVERQARSWMVGCKIVWRLLKKPAAY